MRTLPVVLVGLVSACAMQPSAADERVDRSRSSRRAEVSVRPASGEEAAADAAAPSGEPAQVRRVLVGQVTNARDLGGTPLAGGERVPYGVLFRGAPLSQLGGAGCAEFATLQIRSVLDLRDPSEFVVEPEAPCVEQHARVLHAPLPIPYNVSVDDYIADLDATASIALAFRTLGDAEAYPVYFHCTYGRDRTGILAALVLLALGASRDAIMNEYLLSAPLVGAYPESLRGMLDEVARRGGIEAVLADAGVSSAQLATLRAQASVAQ